MTDNPPIHRVMIPADISNREFMDLFLQTIADAPRIAREARWAANEERVRQKFAGYTVEQVRAMWGDGDPEHEVDCDDIWLFLSLHGAADGLL